MPDREKVVKALELCIEKHQCCMASPEQHCPYEHWLGEYEDSFYECTSMLAKDALALLKEQEAEWIEYPKCLAYDGAYSDSHIVCSACKHVFNIMDNCTEEFDYCPHCGAKMKQEGR